VKTKKSTEWYRFTTIIKHVVAMHSENFRRESQISLRHLFKLDGAREAGICFSSCRSRYLMFIAAAGLCAVEMSRSGRAHQGDG
jgi:hypothetical protein